MLPLMPLMHPGVSVSPRVASFFHASSCTWSHVASDPDSSAAVVIDPVLDFDYAAGSAGTASAEAIVAHVRAARLRVQWILETHAHADHLTAAPYLKRSVGGRIAIGSGIRAVQAHFAAVLGFEPGFRSDGSQFDHLFADDEHFTIGALAAQALAVPGHTSDSVAYRIGDALFVGDSLFMPDVGTARCDFPGGDAGVLYDSIRRLLALADDTRIFVCHDYPPAGREPRCQTTVREQRAASIHVRDGIDRDTFIALRTARDRTLAAPALLYPAVQVNVRAGELPPREPNGTAYLKTPIRGPW